MLNMTSKPVTLRLPVPVYEKAKLLARRRRMSLNRLVLESITNMQKLEEESQLYRDFTVIGADAKAAEVTYAESAQTEVIDPD